jgi:NodT family efflux transporter outer membrane factor (OMF) lipoprotein
VSGRAALRAAALGAVLLIAGCKVGPNFVPPKTASPPAWGPEPADVASPVTFGAAVEARWWDRFDDPELSSLVGRLARQNLDLQAAAERIRQARAQRRIIRSDELPHAEAQGFAIETRPSEEALLKDFEVTKEAHQEFQLYQDAAQASWEVDLFGRVRRAVEAAGADAQAEVEARRAVALAALAELSGDYLQLRALQARQAAAEENLAYARQRQALVRDRVRNGVAADLDLAQADAEAASIAETLPPLREGQARMRNAMALLLAEAPRALDAELAPVRPLPPRPPSVPVGLPSELLRRRPDVLQAEARLHAATARHGAAVADFFPRVSLIGSFGTQSLSTSNLFDWSSRMFMGGPTLTIPLFEGGRLKGQLDLRKSEEREAALSYRQTVLQAWREVDDAMTAYAEAQHRRAAAATALASDRVALAVAERRYRQGVAASLDVISAETTVLQAQDELIRADAEADADLVTLYRALGGGWGAVEAASPA